MCVLRYVTPSGFSIIPLLCFYNYISLSGFLKILLTFYLLYWITWPAPVVLIQSIFLSPLQGGDGLELQLVSYCPPKSSLQLYKVSSKSELCADASPPWRGRGGFICTTTLKTMKWVTQRTMIVAFCWLYNHQLYFKELIETKIVFPT